MNKLVLFAALVVMVTACERYESDRHNSSGIYLNGECIVSIGSTFMGGSMADPSKGIWHRCHMYEKEFNSGPNWNEVSSVVAIMGSWHNDLLYPEPGQIINTIWINHKVLNLDEPLIIPLEHGAYKGGCELVSSVKITNYSAGTLKDTVTGEMNDDGKIDILISLTDGRSLRIHYRGKIPYDGYY